MYRRRRRKGPNQTVMMIVVLFFVALAATSFQMPIVGQNAMLFVLGAIIIIFVIGCAILLYILNELKKRERAITLADVDNMNAEKLFQHQGYKTKLTKRSGDVGGDIIAEKGSDKICVQAKCYGASKSIDRTAVSDAVGAMRYYGCNQIMVITNRYFTDPAKEFASFHNCRLIDRDKLINWILDFQQNQYHSIA